MELRECLRDPRLAMELRYALTDQDASCDVTKLSDEDVLLAYRSRVAFGGEPLWARRLGGNWSPGRQPGTEAEAAEGGKRSVRRVRDMLFSCMHKVEGHERQLENAPFVEVVPEVKDGKDKIVVLLRDDFSPEPEQLIAEPRSPWSLRCTAPDKGTEGEGYHRYEVPVEYIEIALILAPLIELIEKPKETVKAYFTTSNRL